MKRFVVRMIVVASFLLSTINYQLSTISYAQEPPAAKKENAQKYITMLKSAKDEEREEAAEMLAELADPASVDPLIEAMAKDKDPYVRESAAFALGEIGDKKAVPALLASLKADTDAYVRESSAYSLGTLGDETTLPALEEALGKEAEVFVQDGIKGAIKEIKARPVTNSGISNGARKELNVPPAQAPKAEGEAGQPAAPQGVDAGAPQAPTVAAPPSEQATSPQPQTEAPKTGTEAQSPKTQ